MNHKELPPQEKEGHAELQVPPQPQEIEGEQTPAIEDIEMSLEKTGDAHLPLNANAMYMAWLKKKEEMMNSVADDEEKLKALISLDLDKVEILKSAGFIEEARSAFAEVEGLLTQSKSRDSSNPSEDSSKKPDIDVDKYFDRLYDLKEGLFD